MLGFLGCIILGIVLVFGLLYIVISTGLLGNLLAGIACAIGNAIGTLVLVLVHVILDVLRLLALPILIGLGIFLLIWMVRRTFF